MRWARWTNPRMIDHGCLQSEMSTSHVDTRQKWCHCYDYVGMINNQDISVYNNCQYTNLLKFNSIILLCYKAESQNPIKLTIDTLVWSPIMRLGKAWWSLKPRSNASLSNVPRTPFQTTSGLGDIISEYNVQRRWIGRTPMLISHFTPVKQWDKKKKHSVVYLWCGCIMRSGW